MISQEQVTPSLRELYDSYVANDFSRISIKSVLCAIALESAGMIDLWKHPLGFNHAELTPLVGAPAGERFRLHFWLDDRGVVDELGDLHEHTWDLTSLVLAGCVIDSNLAASPTVEGEYLGSRITYGAKNTAEEVGRFDLKVTNVRTIQAGSVYQIPSRTVHLNSVRSVPTVTLVRSVEDGRGDGPLVLTKYANGQGLATEMRTKLRTSEAFDRLTKALSGPDNFTMQAQPNAGIER
ncbi:hypothetical protein [Arthrobacter sp. Bz4]|uniref:hypothetical protein n=1 Tax=Arthrobacter sp. Bz4 TaxID=2171979 RepID=UPI001402305B|nr:hypothetical protein [Arthrobacter sp. Bz4]